MGWVTCMHSCYWKYDKKGNRTVDRKAELDALFTWERKEAVESYGHVYPPMKDTVLKSSMVGSVYYAAVKREQSGKEPKVWAAICLTYGRGRDGSVWGYKDMDETMGPYEDRCPASVLALLTPTDDKDALKWRERCRANIAKAAEIRRNGPKPIYSPTGVTVTVEKQSWLITSEFYRTHTRYTACRFSKRKWKDADVAVKLFLAHYGTAEQKAEWAASGRECPASWKAVAA